MIIVRLSGGMGNQMFQYAMGRALSLRHNVPLKLDTTFLLQRVKFWKVLRPQFTFRNFDLDVFNIKADIAKPEEIGWWNRPFFRGWFMIGFDAFLRQMAFLPGWEKSFVFDERARLYGPNTYLEGFWQSEKYFKEYADVIRADFALKERLNDVQQKLEKEIINTTSVCLHIRRMDIASNSFHDEVDFSYYTKGIACIADKYAIDKLYVFSDDIPWCKEHLKFDYPVFFVEREYIGKKNEGDLTLMTACKHFVIANSTFSWWAAWLGNNPNKIVIAPKKWFGDAHIDDRDLIPESWIRI